MRGLLWCLTCKEHVAVHIFCETKLQQLESNHGTRHRVLSLGLSAKDVIDSSRVQTVVCCNLTT